MASSLFIKGKSLEFLNAHGNQCFQHGWQTALEQVQERFPDLDLSGVCVQDSAIVSRKVDLEDGDTSVVFEALRDCLL